MIDPQYIGYFASVCIVLSFVINLVGCLCFVIYGLMNTPQLWPVIIPNALICMVQVYYLWIKKEAH